MTTPAPAVRAHVNRATLTGYPVRLALDLPRNGELPAKPCPQYKWLHCANEGEYRGHNTGPFTLDEATFDEFVANFRAEPKYTLGSLEVDGKTVQCGIEKVLQFDYEHASEMAPWEGTIPVTGAPAAAWVLDLEKRKGPEGWQLWALAKLGKQIRAQIEDEGYDSLSIAWNPKGVHWQTGKPVGNVLTSIAFTNHPFMRDLQSLAARNDLPGGASPQATGQPPRTAVQPGSSPEAPGDGPSTQQGVSMTATPDVVRTRLCRVYHLNPQADDDSIIRAAENAETNGGTLAAILSVLGIADPQAGLNAVKEQKAAYEKMQKAMAEMDTLMRGEVAADDTADEDIAQIDGGQAMAACQWRDARQLGSVVAHREQFIQVELRKLTKDERESSPAKRRAARQLGRKAFFTHYGVTTDPATQHLSQTFVSGPGQFGGGSVQFPAPRPAPNPGGQQPTQLTVVSAHGQPMQPMQPMQHQRQPLQLSQQEAPTIDLSQYTGRNETEQIMSYLATVDPKFEALDIGVRIQRASQWRKQHMQQTG